MFEITDNSCKIFESVPASDFKNLQLISGKTISELVEKNVNLLVFPTDLKNSDDKIGDSSIFTLTGTQNSAKIQTGNIMGFIGVAGTQIDIRSRFANGGNDFFLHYLIQKNLGLNLLKFEHSSARERILDFLIYLFPSYLNAALTQGIYREYQTFERNDANVRGVIDIARHIAKNLPFAGKIAYRSRERNFDNKITELVRHTIEFLRSRNEFREILNAAGTRENVEKIVAATPNYNLRERQKILNQNLKPLRAPYFSKYVPLQKLCRMILLHESLRYGAENEPIFGVLFDGAWLWEEYLWTLLRERFPELIHGRNRAKKKEEKKLIEVFTNGKREFILDFYVKDKIVLDAKYKRLDKKIPIEDLQQIIAYMHILPSPRGGLLYPSTKTELEGNSILQELGELRGLGGTVFTRALQIPQNAQTFAEFCEQMQRNEIVFLSHGLGAPNGDAEFPQNNSRSFV